jgi:hypothetical protein
MKVYYLRLIKAIYGTGYVIKTTNEKRKNQLIKNGFQIEKEIELKEFKKI